MHTVEYLRER